jgi:hypothetical protein
VTPAHILAAWTGTEYVIRDDRAGPGSLYSADGAEFASRLGTSAYAVMPPILFCGGPRASF